MLNQEEIKTLEQSFLFEDAFKTDKDKKKLYDFLASKHCSISEFSKGETVFGKQGQNELGILLKGKAVAACSTDDKSSLKIFSTGELFGAASVFCKNSSFAKVKAKTSCRVLFITNEGVKRLISDNPETAFKYISFLSNRVEFLNRRIATFTSNQAAERLAKYILDNEGKGTLEGVNFASLARTLDISRASLYRARRELEMTGAVTFGSKTIKIVNKTEFEKVLNKNS